MIVPTRLQELETVIERGLATFVEVGQALREIRDSRLYRDRGYDRFEDYCDQRWRPRLSRDYAYKLIEAAATVEAMSTIVYTDDIKPPEKESHVRPLAPIAREDPEAAAAIWQQEREEHGDDLTARDVEEAVDAHETAETYPFMQRPDWKQYNVLEAREKLEKLPEDERSEAAALLDQPGIPPTEAVKILRNMAEKKPAERKEIYGLSKSADDRERDLALTKAAALPPMPDPRIIYLLDVIRSLKGFLKRYPNDSLNSLYESEIQHLQDLKEKTEYQWRHSNGKSA